MKIKTDTNYLDTNSGAVWETHGKDYSHSGYYIDSNNRKHSVYLFPVNQKHGRNRPEFRLRMYPKVPDLIKLIDRDTSFKSALKDKFKSALGIKS